VASYAGSADRKTGPTAGSQCARILQVLIDRRPHRMEEIHERAGTMRLNSRMAELRGRYGFRITCDKSGGRYVYQLHDDSLDAEAAAYASASSEPDSSTDARPMGAPRRLLSDGPDSARSIVDEQLTLAVA
jgi:hypothetical protein